MTAIGSQCSECSDSTIAGLERWLDLDIHPVHSEAPTDSITPV